MSRILCRYSRKKQKNHLGIYKNQLQEDILEDQMTMKEFIDPFIGEEIKAKSEDNNKTTLVVA